MKGRYRPISNFRIIILLTIIFTAQSYSVEYYKNGTGKPVLFVIAGIHGDERSSIEFTEELKEYKPKKGTIIVIPQAYKEAVKKGIRAEYYDTDLNRVFFKEGKGKTPDIAKEIIDLIEKYQPNIILDLHESWYNYDESKDFNLYMGNTLIFSEESSKRIDELILELIIENNLTGIIWPMTGTLSREIPQRYNIAVLTVETSKKDSSDKRKEIYKNIFNKTLLYLKME